MSDYRPTEYQTLKKLMFSAKDYTSRINGADVNTMIQDACSDAFDKLPQADAMVINRNRQWLIDAAKDRGQRLGERGALELLAAVGDYLNHNGGGNTDAP